MAVFFGTLVLMGACVQIAGIDDPHPKEPIPLQGSDGGPDSGLDSGNDAGLDAGTNWEWANWPMPNPAEAGLPNPAGYVIDTGQGIVTDTVTKLTWQLSVENSPVTWTFAQSYCEVLKLASHDDWRLPTAIELVSLVDFTQTSPNPTIDTYTFPNTPKDWFWTATPAVAPPSPASVWVVSFNTGHSSTSAKTDMYFVRCVR